MYGMASMCRPNQQYYCYNYVYCYAYDIAGVVDRYRGKMAILTEFPPNTPRYTSFSQCYVALDGEPPQIRRSLA